MIGLLPGQVELLMLEADHVRVLASAACTEVFASFDARRPLAVREVAAELGKSPSSVAEHVAKLFGVGLLIAAGSRKRQSRTETLYVHKGVITRFRLQGQPPEVIEAYIDRFDSLMRQASRRHAATQRALAESDRLQGFFGFKQASAYLTRDSAERIRDAIDELIQLVNQLSEPGGPGPDAIRVNLSAFLLPTEGETRPVPSEDR